MASPTDFVDQFEKMIADVPYFVGKVEWFWDYWEDFENEFSVKERIKLVEYYSQAKQIVLNTNDGQYFLDPVNIRRAQLKEVLSTAAKLAKLVAFK